jgi:hypothetical protein
MSEWILILKRTDQTEISARLLTTSLEEADPLVDCHVYGSNDSYVVLL